MRRSVIVGVVLCVCAVVVPATAQAAGARGVAHAGRVAAATRSSAKDVRAAASLKAAFAHAARAQAATVSATKTAPVPVTGNAATLSADPSTGLTDGQQITVSGTGFDAKSDYDIVECPTGDDNPLDCDPGTVGFVKSDSTGSFSAPYTAVRVIEEFVSGTTLDCATAGACDLAALDSNLSAVAETPIGFADVAIIPATVSAVPSTGLLDGQKITVSGTNFTPNAPVGLSECPGPAGDDSCDSIGIAVGASDAGRRGGGGGEPGYGETMADASGSFSTSFTVARIVDGIEGPVDCAQPPGCVLEATNESGTIQATTALTFADVAIVPPVMTATPSTGLEDGQTITVTGQGFSSRDELGLSECAAGTTDGSECVAEAGLGNAAEVQANRHGRFTVSFNVARVITLIDGTIDCSQAPGCVIGAIDLESETGAVTSMVPISFDPKGKVLPPLNLQVHVDPTAVIGAGTGSKGNSIAVEGTISCARTAPTPVDFELQVTEPVGAHQAGGAVVGVASCRSGGTKFTVPISSGRRAKTVFVPGSAGVLLTAFADSGSSAEQTTTNASITVKAPKS
jgi:hypothetical protein